MKTYEIERMLREDVREKKQLFHSAPVSKKRSRKIFFPMDEPSSKKMESYRNGPVKTTRLSAEEMFKMDAERVPNYKEFKKLSDERKREIFERFKERFYTHTSRWLSFFKRRLTISAIGCTS
mgnify:CR=1 FL=1